MKLITLNDRKKTVVNPAYITSIVDTSYNMSTGGKHKQSSLYVVGNEGYGTARVDFDGATPADVKAYIEKEVLKVKE